MILDIPAIASALAPQLLGDGASLSAICIRTTNPKFLLFRDGEVTPVCVAQVGGRQELARTDLVLKRIHDQAPDLVARPLGISSLPGDRFVHLQSGVPGVPWFVLKDLARTRQDWERIARLAGIALGTLRRAIDAYPDWRETLKPGEELRRQARLCREHGDSLTERAQDFIQRQAALLDALGEVSAPYQHGDFCLNNLLIGDARAAVIDFDEFGLTAMPLHDEIGLALSIAELAQLPDLSPFPRHEQFDGLYLHHLLWRINQANPWPTRARMRLNLLQKVEAAATTGRDKPRLSGGSV